jgi:hypothetical protein
MAKKILTDNRAKKQKIRANVNNPLPPQQVADLFCQAAFRRSRGKGWRMKEILEGMRDFFYEGGGAFAVTGKECHPNVPGCNLFMAVWLKQFLKCLQEHIDQIRV